MASLNFLVVGDAPSRVKVIKQLVYKYRKLKPRTLIGQSALNPKFMTKFNHFSLFPTSLNPGLTVFHREQLSAKCHAFIARATLAPGVLIISIPSISVVRVPHGVFSKIFCTTFQNPHAFSDVRDVKQLSKKLHAMNKNQMCCVGDKISTQNITQSWLKAKLHGIT